MKKRTYIYSFAALATAAIAASSVAMNGNSPVASQQDLLDDNRATRAQYYAALARSSAMGRVHQFGLESGDAGLHILHPRTSDEEYSGSSTSTLGGLVFYGLGTSMTWSDIVDAPEPGYENEPVDAVDVSISRTIPSQLLTSATKIPSPTTSGLFAVRVSLDTEAREALAAVHGPISDSQTFTDWAGALVEPGSQATEMLSTLVSDHFSYGAVNISEIVAMPPGAITIIISDQLTVEEADELVAYLND